jgi:pimeloyl-ACP methyl ester carboxylesterase
MSVDRHIPHPEAPDPPEASRPTGVRRVLVFSLVAGAVTAALLAVVVFPGATESVVTGSVLLGFGLGWSLIAVLSVRMTSHPQRWAAVPAVAMTVTGLSLVVLSPQDTVLTWLNWVWPPAVLTMVAWMFVQLRRALPGPGRWLLRPVLLVLALSGAGALVQDVTAIHGEGSYPAPGRTYDVGDHRLHLDCRGTGGPTVVLFSGLGEMSASWARIVNEVDQSTRVCAYDRAGQAWSDDVATAQDGREAAEDLHVLLEAAGEAGPFVLVGHSIGGPYAMTYAAQYPDEVAGMVLLDSSSPRQLTDIPSYPTQYAVMRRGLALLPTLARLGLGGLISSGSDLPGATGDRVAAMTSSVRAFRNARDEVSMIPEVFEQAQALTTLGDRPLVVLTASETLATDGWVAAQEQLAGLSTHGVRRDVDSTHAGLVDSEHGATESARAIGEVVLAVRDAQHTR